MHDIWNPWHGCKKVSEGCRNCYMYYLDKKRANKDGSIIYKTKGFNYPLSKDKNGNYKIKSGEMIRVCMNSDFFLSDADNWRDDAFRIMKIRSDIKFFLLTKRPERVLNCLPLDWNDGYDNVFFNVTCENQDMADKRIPELLKLPFKHKGIMCAPFIGKISIDKYLKTGKIEQVICGGENYDGARVCDFDWVKDLRDECVKYNVRFCFIETGNIFKKDNKIYKIKSKRIQSKLAFRLNLNYKGKKIDFKLKDMYGRVIDEDKLYKPHYRKPCLECGIRLICNGCSDCGKCKEDIIDIND